MDSVISWFLITFVCFYVGIKFLFLYIKEQEERERQSEYFWNLEGK